MIDRGALDHCRIVMLWTTDEEVGSTTSRALIEAEATKSEAVLVFEPSLPAARSKPAAKGVGHFEMIARGVAAHCRPRSRQGRQRDSRAGSPDHRRSTISRIPRTASR
jgi:glutamate carboxypeptidase